MKLEAVATSDAEPDWMRGFGTLSKLHRETARVQASIDEAFDVLEPEDCA